MQEWVGQEELLKGSAHATQVTVRCRCRFAAGSATDWQCQHRPRSLEPGAGNGKVQPREVVDLVKGHLAVMVAIVDEEPVTPKLHRHVGMLRAMMLLDVMNLEDSASKLGPVEELTVGKLGLADETSLEVFRRNGDAVRHVDRAPRMSSVARARSACGAAAGTDSGNGSASPTISS